MSGKSSEEQLLEFLYACPVGLIECDLAGDIVMMNPHAMQHLLPLAGPRDAGNLFAALEHHAPELRSMATAYQATMGRVCDGHRIFVDLGPGPRTKAPRVLACTMVKLGADRLMVTLSDISQQVVQEERLRQADTWFATLLDGVNDYAAVAIDVEGVITAANACFTRQTGFDSAVTMGRNLAEVLQCDNTGGDLRLGEQIEIAGRDGWHLQEGWQARANGERYWCQRLVVARSELDTSPFTGFSVILRDVPRREAAAEDVRRLLTCDHLTGAANRRHFSQALEREQAHWRELRHSLSLIVLDLDHFKSVNDTYGHPMGDLLLRRVAEVCATLLPPRGIFARLGGEEFGALLPRYDREQALGLAEQMRQRIAAISIETPDGALTATASLGCATLDEAGGSIDSLIKLADERLYAAKQAGRNQVHRLTADAA
ncbi:sensor domain-containing diguanylate cyclase [Sphingomonas sp. BK345]|uniref:sensor domain-containing diguanylate cyclase n=1 Tax=Sphingomonas sp. BK345 TaxID=2586980 RepID=UPI0016228879|nr:sensor domain-containing diguanylate cyclase [Sphingomonas sp. BK345]MBB3475189.1 diguanylate cyclase (GGDEF)-like protein/PAS domain S-box-containing protein [Sphingomonas sp. BK345]